MEEFLSDGRIYHLMDILKSDQFTTCQFFHIKRIVYSTNCQPGFLMIHIFRLFYLHKVSLHVINGPRHIQEPGLSLSVALGSVCDTALKVVGCL